MEKILCAIQIIMFILKLVGYLKISWLTVFIPGIISIIYVLIQSILLIVVGYIANK